MNNLHAWIRYSRRVFRPQIAVLRDVVTKRLLPTFESIKTEADVASNDAWERLNAAAGPDSDPASAADAAEDAGIIHCQALADTRQGLLNLFAVALHHLVEQQQITVLLQELILRDEVVSLKMLSVAEFVKRLLLAGVLVEKFRCWREIEELRNVANAVKHAEGPSAAWLHDHRPEIFTAPCLRRERQLSSGPVRWLFQPLSGQDLFVTIDDLERYFRAAETFWQEFEETLALKAQNAV